MFDFIRYKNFRCFKDTDELKIAPITLLVGENNSGKSAILQGLHLIALTLQSEDPSICFKLLHKDYDYGSFEDIILEHKKDRKLIFSFGKFIDIERLKAEKKRGESEEEKIILNLTYGYLPQRKEIYLSEFILEDKQGERLRITPRKYSEAITVNFRGCTKENSYLSLLMVRRGFLFKPKGTPWDTYDRLNTKYGKKRGGELMAKLWNNVLLINKFANSFSNIRYLGPLRIYPSRTYLYTGEMSSRVGARGETALKIYSALLKRGKKVDMRIIKNINKALYKLGFIRNLEIEKIGKRHYEFWTQHKMSKLRANLADTGFGTSQVLPVLVSLYTAPSYTTLLYEQPEIHLHPAAQAELGSVFVENCSKDKKIIIETHSENLILRIQTEIAKGNLKSEDVIIYYVKPDKKGHKVIEIPINEKGEFKVKWPKGFFEESYQESLKLARARNRSKSGKRRD